MVYVPRTVERRVDVESSLDTRELEVVRGGSFFEQYRDELKMLFTALGKEEYWSDDPREVVSKIQNWIGGEHGNSAEKDQFTDEQVAAAMPILDAMRFTGEARPQAGDEIDDVLVIAGTTTANYRRTKLVLDALDDGMSAKRVFITAGQRPATLPGDKRTPELLAKDGVFPGSDLTHEPWADRLLKQGALESIDKSDPHYEENAWKFTETETARVALEKQIKLRAHQIHLQIVNDTHHYQPHPLPGIPERLVTDYVYHSDDEQLDFHIMNAAAVERGINPKTGEPNPYRHTTASVIEEYLQEHNPAPHARVLFVTGNPHSLRTTRDAYKILQQYGRDDIELVVAGTSPAEGTPIQSYLGEIARLVSHDAKKLGVA